MWSNVKVCKNNDYQKKPFDWRKIEISLFKKLTLQSKKGNVSRFLKKDVLDLTIKPCIYLHEQ